MLTSTLLKKYMLEKSNELIFIKSLLTFGVATLSIVGSLFLNSLGYSNSQIGIIVAITTLLSFITSLFSTYFLEKIDEYKLFLISLFMPMIFLITLIFYPIVELFILFLIISSIFATTRSNSFSILFKDITKKKDFTKKESLLYSMASIGWFIGPLMGGLLIKNYSFSILFTFAAFFYFLSLIFGMLIKVKLKNKHRKVFDLNLIKNIKYFFSKKELIKSYMISFSCAFWYALIFIYIPLFIIEKDLGSEIVGIFIASTQLPLIFIQFKLEYFIKKFKIKNLLVFSFFSLSLISLALFFYSNIYFVLIILFVASFVLGFIEPLREIIFFQNVNLLDEEKTFPIFNTSYSLGGILGKLAMAGVLFILPQNFIYFLVFIIMGITTYIAHSLKNHSK